MKEEGKQIVAKVFKGATDALLDRYSREAIIRRQGGRCFYCDKELSAAVIFDHLIPRNLGGRHGPSSRVAACRPCDRKKGGRAPSETELRKFKELHPESLWRRLWKGKGR